MKELFALFSSFVNGGTVFIIKLVFHELSEVLRKNFEVKSPLI